MLQSQPIHAGHRRAAAVRHPNFAPDTPAAAIRQWPSSEVHDAPRVLFYSHDSYGLGHIRRTLSLCQTVRERYEDASLLVLTGSSAISTLPIPKGVDWVKLPCVTKVADEEYRSKFLALGFDAIRSVRREIIFSTAQFYRPSLVLVDNVPLGLKGELRRTLEALREWDPEVRVVLTLRDVLDAPARIVNRWNNDGTYATLERLYDHVMVYGSPDVFDVVKEYQFPDRLAAKVSYAGYIKRTPQGLVADTRAALLRGADRLVLVTVGGGGDGAPLVEQYLLGLEAAGSRGVDANAQHLIVCGPEMPVADVERLRARHGHRRDVTIVTFAPDLVTTMAAADVVVGMGGYNTICEVLSLRKPAVIMPRRRPRLEQWIRCTRLAEMGLIRVVDPDDDPATALVREVRAALGSARPPRAFETMNGLTSFDALLPRLLGGARS
ncbi:MAG: glycosyltransferase [Vicinamibacterales bacterium]